MKISSHSAYSYLDSSRTAHRIADLDLGFGRSCAIWTNRDDHVVYDHLEGHTFSFYRRGGRGVYRVDEDPVEGWEGAVCIFPHGQSSEWVLASEPIEMVHLYLPDSELRRMFSEWTDRDSRLMQLADVTYASAGDLANPFEILFRSLLGTESVQAECAMMDLVSMVISQDDYSRRKLVQLKGGLSAATQRKLVEYIEAQIEGTIRLQELATIAGLSEFHLQRSFKETCGVTPHVWISHRRLTRAKEMISDGTGLNEVALACGFSSQSHLTRSFKIGTGVTPASYRKSVLG